MDVPTAVRTLYATTEKRTEAKHITDENRAKLVESGQLRTVIRFLNDRSLLPLLLPVLYNVIVDYGTMAPNFWNTDIWLTLF